MDPKYKTLVGRKILSLSVSEGEATLRLDTDAGPLYLQTWGDCCSETWFADITGVDALIGGTIADVESADLPSPLDDRSRQDCDQAYGLTITTDKGRASLAYRNSSNGYYGGDCEVTDKPSSYLSAWRPITDDWTA